MKKIFSNLQLFLDKINKDNSSLYKIKVLKESYPSLIDNTMLNYIYNTDILFNVSSKNVIKRKKNNPESVNVKLLFKDLYSLLNALKDRTITGSEALDQVIVFIEQNKKYEDIIYKIIDKSLEIGLNVNSINKIIPNCIQNFKVLLAEDYQKFSEKIDSNWYISRKLDGVRLITKYYNKDKIEFYSRQGKKFHTLNNLIPSLIQANIPDNSVLDGELCIWIDNNENFKLIHKSIRKDNYNIENPRYNIFDILTIKEFEEQTCILKYKDRYKQLLKLKENDNVKILNQYEYNETKFKELQETAIKNKWEGLILRNNTLYEYKRTSNILKFKKFKDKEFIVKNIEISDIPILENGKKLKKTMVKSLIIEYEGNQVNVGSGLTLENRQQWFKNPELIIGKTITVKYFEESSDKNDNKSIRFPILKCVHETEKE